MKLRQGWYLGQMQRGWRTKDEDRVKAMIMGAVFLWNHYWAEKQVANLTHPLHIRGSSCWAFQFLLNNSYTKEPAVHGPVLKPQWLKLGVKTVGLSLGGLAFVTFEINSLAVTWNIMYFLLEVKMKSHVPYSPSLALEFTLRQEVLGLAQCP